MYYTALDLLIKNLEGLSTSEPDKGFLEGVFEAIQVSML